MSIRLACDELYCSRFYERGAKDAKDWRAIEVRVDRNDAGTEVSVDIDVWPIDPEKLNLAHSIACPHHWRAVAESAAEDIEWFPAPDEPEEEGAPATPPSVEQQAAAPIDPDPQF